MLLDDKEVVRVVLESQAAIEAGLDDEFHRAVVKLHDALTDRTELLKTMTKGPQILY